MPDTKHNNEAQQRVSFNREIDEVGRLYEEGKDCLNSISFLVEDREQYYRLYEILNEFRNKSVEQLKNIYGI